ncbi:Protein of unknown function (DUF2919) [Rheinheimera sp. A13L]|uniref:DUF2919 family protein n=1 Tax=Rheinheimera sp. A13L TaxID=506534 RepID=UPI0002124DE3|nr:DUF2919 family protein [Rheinheimera sp. A13L]EGM76036.1 Protein of unknown function (DUF2919) [Rheinheimera sp. A13L]
MSEFYPLLDKNGLLRIPLRFYAVLLLLMRPFIVWIIALTMPEGGDRFLAAIYPKTNDFATACLIACPLLLVVMALSQRKEKSHNAWFKIWQYGRWIMLMVACADLVHTVSNWPNYMILKSPQMLAVPMFLLSSIMWLYSSEQLKLISKEWPETKKVK